MSCRYSRTRFVAYGVLVSMAFVAILGRLVWIQVVRHSDWKARAVRQSSMVAPVTPRRGAMLDRLGFPLALTEERYKIGVTDPAAWRSGAARDQLAAALGLSPREIERRLNGRSGHSYIAKDLVVSPAVADSLRRVCGLSVDQALERRYPMGPVASRLLGRVDHKGRGDAGIEQMCDEILAGRPGKELQRFDGAEVGGAIMKVELEAPVPGRDVLLTLDHRVQMILEEELIAARDSAQAESAMGVVMDPWTAEVLAFAQVPQLSDRGRRAYVSDEWRNAAVLDAFEPGSSFKLFTMASLLSRALCDTSEIWDGEGDPKDYRSAADMGGFFFHDVHPVGEVSLRHAFAVSSNIIMGKASALLRPQEFHDDLRRFGLGMPSGSGLPGETPGVLHNPTKWSKRTQATMAIGQEVSVGMLQLCAGYAALLTDGCLRAPRFLHAWVDDRGELCTMSTRVVRERVVPPEVVPVLRGLCRDVVELDYGSGREARVVGWHVAGKTGTAQVSQPGRGYLPDVYVANFIGVVPAEAPRLLCAIVVNRPAVEKRWGGTTAAQAFASVISKIMAGTELLDSTVGEELTAAAVEPAVGVSVPNLLGLRGSRAVERAEAAACVLSSAPPHPDARIVGQMPPAGARLVAGGRVQVAWAGGGTR